MDAIDRVLDLLRQPTAVVFVGAGLSIGVGYASWPQLIERLCERCGVDRPTDNSFAELTMTAEACRHNNPIEYQKVLLEEFGEDTHRNRSRPAHRHLMRLNPSAIVTTNFDYLLKREAEDPAAPECNFFTYPLLRDDGLYSDRLSIYHVHGIAELRNDSLHLVLTSSDFDEAYDKPGLARDFLTRLFLQHPVLLVGLGAR